MFSTPPKTLIIPKNPPAPKDADGIIVDRVEVFWDQYGKRHTRFILVPYFQDLKESER